MSSEPLAASDYIFFHVDAALVATPQSLRDWFSFLSIVALDDDIPHWSWTSEETALEKFQLSTIELFDVCGGSGFMYESESIPRQFILRVSEQCQVENAIEHLKLGQIFVVCRKGTPMRIVDQFMYEHVYRQHARPRRSVKRPVVYSPDQLGGPGR